MPTQVVEIDLQTDIGAIPVDTFSDLLVVSTDPTVQDPSYADPKVYDNTSQVAVDFGSESDAYTSSQEIASQGADAWWIVAIEAEARADSFQPATGEEMDEGELEYSPLKGGVDNVDASAGGEDLTVVPTVDAPPNSPDSGEIAINFDTGEFALGEPINDEEQVEVEYETLDWESAEPEMSAGGFDIVILADTHADRSYIGELDQLVTWATGDDAAVIVAYDNGDNYSTHEEAVDAAHDIGSYIPSGNLLPIAHRSTDDVAAGVAGRVSTRRPWFDPFYDGGANYGFSMQNYRESLIGAPESPNTFEGGRGQDEAAGPANVLHRMEGTQVLTNSLTTAGRASDYQFWDIKRTESFIVSEVNRALRSLRLRQEHIPFSPSGKALIEDALKSNLLRYVATGSPVITHSDLESWDDPDEEMTELERIAEQRIASGSSPGGKPLSALNVHVPRFSDLPRSDRANRRWSGIVIDAQLAGNVHTFEVELAVHV
jgi:hypothetical protein